MARFFRNKSLRNARRTGNIRKVHRPLWVEPFEDRRLLAVTIPGNFDFFVTAPDSTNIDIGADPDGDNAGRLSRFEGSSAVRPVRASGHPAGRQSPRASEPSGASRPAWLWVSRFGAAADLCLDDGDFVFLQTDGHAIRLIAIVITDCR